MEILWNSRNSKIFWKLWELYGYQKAKRDEELLNSNAGENDFESFFNEFRTILDDMKQKSEQNKESPVSKLFDKWKINYILK